MFLGLGICALGWPLGVAVGQAGLGAEVIELEAQVVTASPFVATKEELLAPASELGGRELERVASSSLGGTLDGVPGVHSTYNGPGAGRPVIRGFDGDRVRILNQGTDSFDVSFTSPDHGVSVEPLFAEEIEVVRGPASLLYGNAAIGGVVNVIGKELPSERAAGLKGQFETSYGSAADEWSAGLALQGGAGNFAWSIGYLDRRSGDVEIPGFAESAYQMAMEEEEHEEDSHGEHEEDEDGHEEEEYGVLGNSFVDTRTGYVGAGWFGEKGSFGFSYSVYDTQYGVPGHSHGHEEEHEDHDDEEHEEEDHDEHEEHGDEESVTIDLRQSRFGLRGVLIQPIEFFETVEAQFAYGDYQHRELEGDEVGTTFSRYGYELRVTGVHRPLGNFTGAVGLQLREDAFSADGEEAFVPSNDAGAQGLFVVERLFTDWGAWEFGGRVETVRVAPDVGDLGSRRFTTGNASAGFYRRLGEGTVVAANVTYAERAPNASELYAFGPHIGTRSFEIGNARLGKEDSVNLDLSLRRSVGAVTGELTLFYADFDDYVFMDYLSEDEVAEMFGELDTHGLAARRSTAADARFHGYELDLRFHLIEGSDRRLHFDLLVDQTRATNRSDRANLPRIPARRFGGRLEYEAGPWTVGVEARHSVAVSHLAPDELPTDGYTLWGADLRYRIGAFDTMDVDLFAIGRNLGDEEARPHSSFLKDMAPLPGRDIRVGLATRF